MIGRSLPSRAEVAAARKRGTAAPSGFPRVVPEEAARLARGREQRRRQDRDRGTGR